MDRWKEPHHGKHVREVVDTEAVLARASDNGLVAALKRGDLTSAERGLLALLADFGEVVPGAKEALAMLSEEPIPEFRRRYKIAPGGGG